MTGTVQKEQKLDERMYPLTLEGLETASRYLSK